MHEYYNTLVRGQTPQLVVEQAYLATQQYYLAHLAESERYWAEHKALFQGANDLAPLLTHRVDLTRIKAVEKPAEQALIVQGNTYGQLKHLCRAQGVSEVYEPLANALSDRVNCIGIDNYNLCTDNHIDSLQQIARIYMKLILTETAIDQPIRILGWSLGGQLAMEIAFQLEQLGAKEIQLFLLDTVMNTDEIKALRNKLDISSAYRQVTRKLQDMGARETYINKVLAAIPFESGIADCHLSGKLSYANITLFKAGQASPHHKEGVGFAMSQLIAKIPDNNISPWAVHPLVIKMIEDCYHENMIESVPIISTEIMNTLSMKDNH
ncbi:thioesterase domain-containing protein [Xenorhabdus sp. IM139775]|uniref:thioesterase domain-containing protein n=1 Tax=Xenorhabdus sp. IM139775 TaxID=3025876 RepID=UPI00235A43C5|nr:thioesterase domain-containing protein [Xenorhabdus sp. IM139775]MDC9592089.1 thioesterase domain-containing protein [Xenorhabdus sp. IM139775]